MQWEATGGEELRKRAVEISAIGIAIAGNLARHPSARRTLVEKGLMQSLCEVVTSRAERLKHQVSGVQTSEAVPGAQAAGGAGYSVLITAVRALQGFARDDASAATVARQGALQVLMVVVTYARAGAWTSAALLMCNILSCNRLGALLETLAMMQLWLSEHCVFTGSRGKQS